LTELIPQSVHVAFLEDGLTALLYAVFRKGGPGWGCGRCPPSWRGVG